MILLYFAPLLHLFFISDNIAFLFFFLLSTLRFSSKSHMLPFVTNQPKPFKWFWNYKHRIVFFTLFIKNLLLALTKMQSFRDFCSCPLKEMTCFLLYKLRIDLAQSVPFSPMFRLFRNFPTVLFALI